MTEAGIHNLLTLFLILASVVGAREIVSFFSLIFNLYFHFDKKKYSLPKKGQQLQSILLKLRLEKLLSARQSCLIKGHMALLILYSEQEVNIQNYANRVLEQVNKLNSDESKLPVLRIMIDAVERIFDKPDFFALDEYLLFGKLQNQHRFTCNFNQIFSFVMSVQTLGSLTTYRVARKLSKKNVCNSSINGSCPSEKTFI